MVCLGYVVVVVFWPFSEMCLMFPKTEHFNTFTAPDCKISGLKGACKQYIFRSYNTSTSNAERFDETPFTCLYEKGNQKASGF